MIIHDYIKNAGPGASAKLSRQSGLAPAVISKILHNRLPVSLETALKLHVCTNGVLSLEENCPKHAEAFKALCAQIEAKVRTEIETQSDSKLTPATSAAGEKAIETAEASA